MGRRIRRAAWDIELGPEGTDIACGRGAVALRSNIGVAVTDGEDVDLGCGEKEWVGHLNLVMLMMKLVGDEREHVSGVVTSDFPIQPVANVRGRSKVVAAGTAEVVFGQLEI